MKPRILFLTGGATLAHVVRPLALARHLSSSYEIFFGRPSFYSNFTENSGFQTVDISGIQPKQFAKKLSQGRPLFSFEKLIKDAEEDLRFLAEIRPDFVIGDLRLSLSVTARILGIPYFSICDAYWYPSETFSPPLPSLAFTSYMPIPLAQWLFDMISPHILALHAKPFYDLHSHFGTIPSDYLDIRSFYTDADRCLFANPDYLFSNVERNGTFLGPLSWEPEGEIDVNIPVGVPSAYVSMGSSGDHGKLTAVVNGLARAGIFSLISTGGQPIPKLRNPSMASVHSFLPGNKAARLTDIVVCNGGSPSVNQALAAGKPIIAVANNMDQYLSADTIESKGFGIKLRSDRLNENIVTRSATKIIEDRTFFLRTTKCQIADPNLMAANILKNELLNVIRKD